MGIALLSAARLVESVPVWFQRFWPESSPAAVQPTHQVRKPRLGGSAHTNASTDAVATPNRRPLRVLRVVDAQHAGVGTGAGVGAGRMVISGRMADVCAELDRLAAAEALQSGERLH